MTKSGNRMYVSKGDKFSFRVLKSAGLSTKGRGRNRREYLGEMVFKHHHKDAIFSGRKWAFCGGDSDKCEYCKAGMSRNTYFNVPIILVEDGQEYLLELTSNVMMRLIDKLDDEKMLDKYERVEIQLEWDGTYTKEYSDRGFSARKIIITFLSMETKDIMSAIAEPTNDIVDIEEPTDDEAAALKELKRLISVNLNETFTEGDVSHTLESHFKIGTERAKELAKAYFVDGKIIL